MAKQEGIRSYSAGGFNPIDVEKGLADSGDGEHLWAVGAIWQVRDVQSYLNRSDDDPYMLDSENMSQFVALSCYKCGYPYSEELAEMPCKGVPVGADVS